MSVSINITMPEIAPNVAAIIDVSKMFKLVNGNRKDNKSYAVFRSDDNIFRVVGKKNDAIHTVVLVSDPTENVTVNGDGEKFTAYAYDINVDDDNIIHITLDCDEHGEGHDDVNLTIAAYGGPHLQFSLGVTSLIYKA